MDERTPPRTISELAALLGVSTMTIHRAITGKPDISPATRSRILAEIERLGWRPNIAARGLRQGKTYTLGILVSNVAASFLPEILQGVDRTAEERGYHAFVSVHEHDVRRAERHLRTLQSKGVDGLVVYPTDAGEELPLLNELLEGHRVALIMRDIPGFRGPVVMIDDRLGGRIAAEHLLALGHRCIGFLGYRDHPFSGARREGWEEALREVGVPVRSAWIAEELPVGDPGPEAAARILADPADRPTALFCASDRIAARAIQAAAALGLRVPRDLSVVGYNGDPWGALLTPPLTTVAQPREEVGRRAAQLVLDGESEAAASRIVLSPWLVTRGSTAPLASRNGRTGRGAGGGIRLRSSAVGGANRSL